MNRLCSITIKRIFFILSVFIQIFIYFLGKRVLFIQEHKEFILKVILPVIGIFDAYFCEMVFRKNSDSEHRITQEENNIIPNVTPTNRPQNNLRRINSNDNLLSSSRSSRRNFVNNIFENY